MRAPINGSCDSDRSAVPEWTSESPDVVSVSPIVVSWRTCPLTSTATKIQIAIQTRTPRSARRIVARCPCRDSEATMQVSYPARTISRHDLVDVRGRSTRPAGGVLGGAALGRFDARLERRHQIDDPGGIRLRLADGQAPSGRLGFDELANAFAVL